jgi:hypothetical protein
MKTITILAIIAILAGIGFLATNAMTSAIAQTIMDNATVAGNMTAGNVTGGNMTADQVGSISKKTR